jgi:hypothetical protein
VVDRRTGIEWHRREDFAERVRTLILLVRLPVLAGGCRMKITLLG